MIVSRLGISTLLVALAVVLLPGVGRVSAMPLQPVVSAKGSITTVACERGGPNCLPTDPTAPTKCGGPGNPCVIDGGPDCQNASSCGTDNTGDHNLNGASNMPGVISDIKSPTGGGTPKGGESAAKPAGGPKASEK